MRKRVIAAETTPAAPIPPEAEAFRTGPVRPLGPPIPNVPKLFCGDCGLPLRDPFGTGSLGCANGHVDPLVVTGDEAEAIRKTLLGNDGAQVEKKVAALEQATAELAGRKGAPTNDEVAKVLVQAADVLGDTVKAISGELKEALDAADAMDPSSKRDATSWGNANKAQEVELDPAFMSIVKTLVINNPLLAYKSLEQELVVGENRADYGSVMKHLDRAETNAREAHRLWQSAILERKRWELDNAVVFAAMEEEALRTLQHEKDQKSRAKMITDADVQTRVAILFPDEYRSQEIKRLKAKSMVDSMQNLADLWISRCKTLQVILSKQR